VFDRPKHDYTIKLVDSVPRSEAEWLRAAASDYVEGGTR
jgi:hypothetical protein